jgi:hypothetical protein
MDLIPTAALFAAFAAVFAFASWRAMKPAGLTPRVVPWRIVVLAAGAVALYLLVHLVNLMGMTTGRQSMPGA